MENIPTFVTDWVAQHGWRILLILVIAYFVQKFSKFFITQAIRRAVREDMYGSHTAEVKREDTLIGIFQQLLTVLVWLIAALMVLSELGIDTAPLIASAGIVGIAFGFGGQYLIKDLISGVFIILENQYRVGDVVKINGIGGLVENINMRTTILRDLDGTVHHVPNGEITTASNLSSDFANINMDIGVAYEADIEKVEKVINKVGDDLATDENWSADILEAPQFVRISEFADSAVVIKILGKTQPMRQWAVTGEMRKRIKIAFDKNKIGIPYPQRVVHTLKK